MQAAPAPAAPRNARNRRPADAPADREPNRWPGPCHRCETHLRSGAGVLVVHPLFPRKRVAVCVACADGRGRRDAAAQDRDDGGRGGDAPVRDVPECSAEAARAMARMFAMACEHRPELAAVLGPAARLCAWRSGDALAARMIAGAVAGDPHDDDAAIPPPADVEPVYGDGADLVAEILGRRAPEQPAPAVLAPAPEQRDPIGDEIAVADGLAIATDSGSEFTMTIDRYGAPFRTLVRVRFTAGGEPRDAAYSLDGEAGGHWVLGARRVNGAWTIDRIGGFASKSLLAPLGERWPNVAPERPAVAGERHTVVRGVGHVRVSPEGDGWTATIVGQRDTCARWTPRKGWDLGSGFGGTEAGRMLGALRAIVAEPPARAKRAAKPANARRAAAPGDRWAKFRDDK